MSLPARTFEADGVRYVTPPSLIGRRYVALAAAILALELPAGEGAEIPAELLTRSLLEGDRLFRILGAAFVPLQGGRPAVWTRDLAAATALALEATKDPAVLVALPGLAFEAVTDFFAFGPLSTTTSPTASGSPETAPADLSEAIPDSAPSPPSSAASPAAT